MARKKSVIESTVEYDQSLDPREQIFHYAKDSGWVILKMNPVSDNLEDVFRDLTSTRELTHE